MIFYSNFDIIPKPNEEVDSSLSETFYNYFRLYERKVIYCAKNENNLEKKRA